MLLVWASKCFKLAIPTHQEKQFGGNMHEKVISVVKDNDDNKGSNSKIALSWCGIRPFEHRFHLDFLNQIYENTAI